MWVVATFGTQNFWPYGAHSVFTTIEWGELDSPSAEYTWPRPFGHTWRKVIFAAPAGLGVQLAESFTDQDAWISRGVGSWIQCTPGSVSRLIVGVKIMRRTCGGDEGAVASITMSARLALVLC